MSSNSFLISCCCSWLTDPPNPQSSKISKMESRKTELSPFSAPQSVKRRRQTRTRKEEKMTSGSTVADTISAALLLLSRPDL